jgi:hypothetical protein
MQRTKSKLYVMNVHAKFMYVINEQRLELNKLKFLKVRWDELS